MNKEGQIQVIKWEDITIWQGDGDDNLGKGGFGAVLKAHWRRDENIVIDVAVKFLTKKEKTFQELESTARREVTSILNARADAADFVCEVFGIASGQLTEDQGCSRNWPGKPYDLCVGIVMRYESGGSLKNHMQNSAKPPLAERIRIASQICTGKSISLILHNEKL